MSSSLPRGAGPDGAHETGLVILVDDTRTFRAPIAHVRCRTSREGLEALPLLRERPGGQLWLDHDLGLVAGHLDRALPVLDELARAAFDSDPYPVSRVYVHTSNPEGAATMMRVLNRWGYPAVRVVAGDYLIEEELADPSTAASSGTGRAARLREEGTPRPDADLG